MIKLNFKVMGEGFPIVILHGLFGMLDNWQTIGKKLADQGFMVYLIDQRDHGKSPFTDAFDYSILAQDLAHFMEDNWLYKAHVIGHSMGGKAVMQFNFEYSHMVQKMIVVDVCNKAYTGGHEIIFTAIQTLDVAHMEQRDQLYQHFKSYDLDEGTVQFLLKNISRHKEGGFEWKMNVDLLWKSYPFILDKVGEEGQLTDTPTLFIKGELSKYIQDEDLPALHQQFSDAQIVTIPQAGHWVHADQPVALYEAVTSFLNQ